MEDQSILEQFYQEVLGLSSDWKAVGVVKDGKAKTVTIHVVYAKDGYRCPICGKEAKLHDKRIRKLRHLDTCDYQTILEVEVPRVRCDKHKVQQMSLPFADKHSLYTEMFENKVIEMLNEAPTSHVAKDMRLGWDAIDGIMQRGVIRGLLRREIEEVKNLGIDETSCGKGQDYITVIIDKDHDRVLTVLKGRKADTVKAWFLTQKVADLSKLESISMDMSGSFMKVIIDLYPDKWDKLICFDRFHISQCINKALDDVRKREWAMLKASGEDNPLKKMRYGFLENSGLADNRSSKRRKFIKVSKMNLITSRAWRIKELAATLWEYEYMGVAEKNWKSLLWWMSHCRIPEMIKCYHTLKNHFFGILNAIRLKVNNAILESTNNCIQRVKRTACGFRNKLRFMTEVMFHFGCLDMAVVSP
jgi:transposase